MKIGIILTPNSRSNAYLRKLLELKIELADIVFMNDKSVHAFSHEEISKSTEYGFDISDSIESILRKSNLDYTEFNFVNINEPELINHVQTKSIDYYIFTGGGILKEDILNSGSKFLHFHPGIVPEYRGSTCFYYSILKQNFCGVTAFIMDENLDAGNIIHQKTFSKPNHIFLDNVYDAHIRAETMGEIFTNNLLYNQKLTKQNLDDGETYFIIHPVLKHISILSCIE